MSTMVARRPDSGTPAQPETSGTQWVWSLVDAAKVGDRHAFSRLYQLHFGEVFGYLLARTRDHYVAEDLTSETFIRALTKITSVTERRSAFGAWLMTIARNLLIDEARSARSRYEVDLPDYGDAAADEGDPVQAAFRSVWADELRRILCDLSADQRICLELRFFHDLSLVEVGRRMKRRPNAVSAIQFRALRRLSELAPAHWRQLAR